MRRIEVNSGDCFGNLKVVRESGTNGHGKRVFLCQCTCGAKPEVRLDHLRSGHTTTCGRCGIEYGGKRMTLTAWAESHGLKESTLRARLKTMGMREALGRK